MIQLKNELKQIVPNRVCLSCEVCCRFLEANSFLAPIFMVDERKKLDQKRLDLFTIMPDGNSARIKLKPHADFHICPMFDPNTHECTIYPNRPLDCKLYPFLILFNETNNQIFLCVDLICPFAETEISEFNRFADEISDFIQSEPTISQIADHRSLIGAYRSDVKFLRLLDKLTARICTA